MDSKLKKRNEIEEKDKWALEDIYETEGEFDRDCITLEEKIKEMEKLPGTIGESATNLLCTLKLAEDINRICEKLVCYSNMRFHEDTSVGKYQGMMGKAQAICTKAESATSFINPEILMCSEEKIQQFIDENEDDLGIYRKYFSRIFRDKKNTLSQKEEAIIAKMGEITDTASEVYNIFSYADLKYGNVNNDNGDEIELTAGRYVSLMSSKNREVRKEAFFAMYGTIEKYINTISTLFVANAKRTKVYANIRNYGNSLEMSLKPKGIECFVYDNLIATINEHLDTMHRYVALRKKALGVDELHMYDIYVPIVEGSDDKISFEEAKSMVFEGLKPMGEDYLAILMEGFENRWIDIYENEGKRSGAYSWGPRGTHPYVLLNYQGRLDDVFTLAHEMGHALHSYYSDNTQPYVYSHYEIFVAEVASTCNESLLIHSMLKNCKDKKKRAYLINHFLESFKGKIFRQVMFAEFEKITHKMVDEGETPTSDELNEIYLGLNKKYFGEEMVNDEEIKLEWARIPHFYTPFYVYQYATGFAGAIALSRKIMREGENAVRDYMKFLTGGSSLDPIELLKLAGVDLSTAAPIEEALQLFEELLDEMEEIITE